MFIAKQAKYYELRAECVEEPLHVLSEWKGHFYCDQLFPEYPGKIVNDTTPLC